MFVSNVDVAVIVAVPTPLAVTVPLLTVATEELDVDHVTACEAPFVTVTLAVNEPVVLVVKLRLNDDGETVTPVTVGVVSGLTVIA